MVIVVKCVPKTTVIMVIKIEVRIFETDSTYIAIGNEAWDDYIEYLKCRADFSFEVEFGVIGLVKSIAEANSLQLFKFKLHSFDMRQRHYKCILQNLISDNPSANIFVKESCCLINKNQNRILFRKLYAYDIGGLKLILIESCLTEQTQYVISDGKESGVRTVQCGVSQIQYWSVFYLF